jgi:hypothetical protein
VQRPSVRSKRSSASSCDWVLTLTCKGNYSSLTSEVKIEKAIYLRRVDDVMHTPDGTVVNKAIHVE